MNKEKFIDCLRDPSLLQDNEIRELNQLVKKYPYFQGARALLAKVSKERNLKDAALCISSAAVYTTDRSLLKKYISDHLFFLDSREVTKEEKVPPAKTPAATPRPPAQSKETAKQAVPRKSPRNPESTPKTRPEQSKKPDKKETPPSGNLKKTPTPQKIPDVKKVASKEKTPEPKKTTSIKQASAAEEELTGLRASATNLDDWIKEIHEDIEALKQSKARFQEMEKKFEEEEKKKEEEDAVNAALKKVTGSKKTTEDPVKEAEKHEIKPDSSKAVKKNTVKEEEITQDVPDKEEKTPKKAKVKASVKKTTSKKVKSESPTSVKQKEAKSPAKAKKTEVQKKTEKPETKKKPAKKVESPEQEDTSTLKVVRRRSGKVQSTTFESVEAKSEDENKDKIIDEFISSSPKISKSDKSKITSEEEEKEDLSDQSSRFQADIGTEYLAEIYVEQGKVSRAISIYEKLSLKFPEKRSYFVARIEELKLK